MSENSLSEIELQRIYNLSIQEANVYHRKADGQSYNEIAEYLNINPESVKQIAYNASCKIKNWNKDVDLIVSHDCNRSANRRYLAMMCLYVINMDQSLDGVKDGRYCMCLKKVNHKYGDIRFFEENVFPFFNPLCNNDIEAKSKAKEFYELYIKAGGKQGEMGIGFVYWYANKYSIKIDKF